MCNIGCDPVLGIVKAVVGRIPRTCSFCIEQLALP